MRRVLLADKLRAVADGAPKDAVLLTEEPGAPVVANRLLLALCSDFFEAMFRFGSGASTGTGAGEGIGISIGTSIDGTVDLTDVSAEDVHTVVAYSEGRYEPTVDHVDMLMRVQDRFLMPELRQRCDELLREHVSLSTWHDVAGVAVTYHMWDLLSHVVVWASRLQWATAMDVLGFTMPLLQEGRVAPAKCVSAVLRAADFVSVSHKFEVAVAWTRAARKQGTYSDADVDSVFDELRADLSCGEVRLWPGEVQRILEDEDVLPRGVLAAIARAAATSGSGTCGGEGRRRLPQHAGCLSSELRKSMAKVDASIIASSGAGAYQMIISPSTLHVNNAYFSAEVQLASSPNSEYHVYLNEEERLDRWWRLNSRPAMAVIVRFRRAPAVPPPA